MTGELIVLFKSPDALCADFSEIMKKFDSDLSKIENDDMIRAALAGDNRAMAKASGSVTLAKREAARLLRAEHGSVAVAQAQLTLEGMTKLRDAIWDFNHKYAEHKRLEKRSARFHGARR